MAINLDRIRDIVDQAAGGAGCELVDVELRGAGRQRVLRICIDRDGGVSHGDCEQVSREVGTVLDVEDLVPTQYTLEVSSPGLDRKLTRPRDFARFQGHQVRVRTRTRIADRKVFLGRLDGLEDGRIRLTLEANQLIEIPLDVVQETRLEVDWESELHARSR